MDMQSAGYFVFLGTVVILHRQLAAIWRPWLLLAASLLFYVQSAPWNLGIVALACAVNYAAVSFLSGAGGTRARAPVFAAIVAIDLALLIGFKYCLGPLHAWLGVSSPVAASLGVPLGISYLTFQMIAANTDAFRRDWALCETGRDFFLFGLFFPQITSGPIPRAERLLPQLSAGGASNPEDIAEGCRLIAYGLFKKLVVSNRLNDYVTEIFAPPAEALNLHYSTIPTAIGCIFNLLNLYADFSSYVDIAIGSARLVGIRLDPNFDRPLLSTSVTELWRRWHMTLSFWLRDYLFLPLLIRLGNAGNLGVVIALLVTFGICGIWHGAKWTYLAFGIIQGVAMSAELLTRRWRARRLKKLPATPVKVAGWIYAMSVFVLSEIFFRATSLDNASTVFARLFHVTSIGDAQDLFAHKGPFDFAMYFATIALWFGVSRAFRRSANVSTPYFALICALLVLFLGHLGNGRFIYAGF